MKTVLLTHPPERLEQYFGARATRALQEIAQVRFNRQPRDFTLDELVAAAEGCDAIIAYRQTAAPRALFERLPRLAAVLRCAVDIRTIDVAAASEHGVLVTRASPGYVVAVCEWVLGAMIDLARGISASAASYWKEQVPVPAMGMQLRGATLGIIGHGHIGAELATLAQALGMKVLVSDPQPVPLRRGLRQVPRDRLLGQSDVVVLLAPATATTENMMNADAFAAMRPGAFFINASRGELVDDTALLAALERGQVAGCALDVGRAADQLPMPGLARHPRVIATPHIGGLTQPAIEHQAMETVMQLASLLRGEMPAGAVNPEAATRQALWRDPGGARP